ncbi:malonic semialdehyde reductase [Phenylobacterium sp.]|uniref:malonic semialdehyde reductase n=1 Tax=Phenylobacterium sp. TaxID=1871053 RepID=UPI001214603F|nr:malonic semialdehyde reductase [Phenylobacterium sp.]THD54144.1 MAG: malonic semialdehyde reductase [Phenylobacterium sp.]
MSAAPQPVAVGTPSRRALGKVLHSAPVRPVWSDIPISRDVLEQLHALMSLGPTLVDASPTRVLFLNSGSAKARLAPLLPERHRADALAAPACAIVGYDVDFAEQLVEFLPRATAARSCFDDPEVVRQTAARNGALQGAYLIVAARSLDLEAAAFPEFDEAGVSFEFFRTPRVRANFLCSLGYPARAPGFPQQPRLEGRGSAPA